MSHAFGRADRSLNFCMSAEQFSNNACTSKAFQLAPSLRVLAYLAQRARAHQPSMALTVVEEAVSASEQPEIFVPPPAVVTTPCDPWPRPYYLEDGLRKVHPYHYTYNTYCKERWRGKKLLDIFAVEFRDRPTEYYVGVVPI